MTSICNKTRIPYIIVTSITSKIISVNIKLDVIIYLFNFCPTLKNMKKHESGVVRSGKSKEDRQCSGQ
jgi:hypothetical protein